MLAVETLYKRARYATKRFVSHSKMLHNLEEDIVQESVVNLLDAQCKGYRINDNVVRIAILRGIRRIKGHLEGHRLIKETAPHLQIDDMEISDCFNENLLIGGIGIKREWQFLAEYEKTVFIWAFGLYGHSDNIKDRFGLKLRDCIEIAKRLVKQCGGDEKVLRFGYYGIMSKLPSNTKRGCLLCGAVFETPNLKKVYCSKDCQRADYDYKQNLQRGKEEEKRVCAECKCEFMTKHPLKKFCSVECQYTDEKRRKKEKRKRVKELKHNGTKPNR